jgi:hypothetical protein
VIVVVHQRVLNDDPVKTTYSLGQQIKKADAIFIGEVDVSPVVAAIVDVPDGA